MRYSLNSLFWYFDGSTAVAPAINGSRAKNYCVFNVHNIICKYNTRTYMNGKNEAGHN